MHRDYQARTAADLPKAIRAIRLDRGLTGRAFARLIGADPAEISKYETGRGAPGAVRLLRLIRIAPEEHRMALLEQLKQYGITAEDLGHPLMSETSEMTSV